jgi:integrase
VADGAPLHPDFLTRRFHHLVGESGLPPVRLHDLRHGAASLAHCAGVDLKTVRAQLGHSSIVLTADTYTSVLSDLLAYAADATSKLILTRRGPQPGPRHRRNDHRAKSAASGRPPRRNAR